MLDAAIALWEAGFHVFPLGDNTTRPPDRLIERYGGLEEAQKQWPKHPRIAWKRYQKVCPEREEVEGWFTRWPNANIGIVTGPQVVVVDADDAAASAFIREGNITRTPWIVKTGRGEQFYYQCNPRMLIRNSASPSHLDVRGVGGYVVAPPSVHANGAVYTWERVPGYADIPSDLPMLTERDIAVINGYQGLSLRGNDGQGADVLDIDLARVKAPAAATPVEPGGRNNAAASLVGQYIHQGLSLTEIKQCLDNWNTANPVPLPTSELNNTLASVALTHTHNHPDRPIPLAPKPQPPKNMDSILSLEALLVSDFSVDFLVDHYIVEHGVNQIFGESGHKKSFISLDIAMHIAAGKAWHGHAVKPGWVLYVAGEDIGGYKARATAWVRHHGIEPSAIKIAFRTAPVLFPQVEAVDQLRHELDTLCEHYGTTPALIVLDTKARCLSGNEDKASDASEWINAVDAIRAAYRTTFTVIHHTGHNEKNRARGSYAFLGALDSEYKVTKNEAGDVSFAAVKEPKNGEKPPTKYFSFDTIDTHLTTSSGDPVTSLVPVESEQMAYDPDSKTYNVVIDNAIEGRVNTAIELVKKSPGMMIGGFKMSLKRVLNLSESSLKPIVREVRNHPNIRIEKDGRIEKIYWVDGGDFR